MGVRVGNGGNINENGNSSGCDSGNFSSCRGRNGGGGADSYNSSELGAEVVVTMSVVAIKAVALTAVTSDVAVAIVMMVIVAVC